MRYGSVCSGIEAATVAWHPLGWEPVWFAEIEDFPSRVLAHHYPHVKNYGDFTQIPDSVGPIDLLVGGTPCQSFSVAGLRGGLTDERGNLALEYCRLAARLRPRWIVWENVPGVLSSNRGRDFGSILGALAELGYGLAYRVLDAQFFGVPQRRRRVFLVGYLGDWRRAAAVLFEPESLRGHPPAKRQARKEATPGARAGTAEHGGVAPAVTAKWSKGTGGPAGDECQNLIPVTAGTLGGGSGSRGWACDTDRMTFIPAVAGTLGAGSKGYALNTDQATFIPHCMTGTVAHTLRAEGFDASEDGTGRGTPIVSAPGPIAFHHKQTPISGSACPTLGTTTNGMGIVTLAARRLTPRECERLQGFPDDYTAIPGSAVRVRREKLEADWIKYMRRGGVLTLDQVFQLAADGPRYRALGNSMAVPCMRWIGERIVRVERLTR